MDPNSMMDKKKAAYYMRNRSSSSDYGNSPPPKRGQGENAGTRLFQIILFIIAVPLGLRWLWAIITGK
jgi:hypothetical protein